MTGPNGRLARTGTGAVDVLVAIPARDEADRLAGCLESVRDAARAARAGGWIDRVRVAVVAHRCTDSTAAVAVSTINRWPDVEPFVLELDEELMVGAVRTTLARRAVSADPALAPDRLWLFSTDADSAVPTDWISGHLNTADRAGADLVAGLVDLVDWRASRSALRSYRRMIADGLLPDGGHTHAYAANLAVRWIRFEQLGGFPALRHGEEAGLIKAARAAGLTVATPRQPTVRTSGRIPGRAQHGLSALLQQLGHRPG